MRIRGFDKARGSGLLIPASATLAGIGEAGPNEPPPPTDRPGASNTGPRIALTPSGGFSTTRGGTAENPLIIRGLDINGSVTIRHSFVELWDCDVDSTSKNFAITINTNDPNGNEVRGIKIMHTRVQLFPAEGGNACIGGLQGTSGSAYGDKLEVGYCDFSGYSDAIKYADWSYIHHNWVHDMDRAPGTKKHVDGFQNPGHDHTLTEYNFLDIPFSAGKNACIFHQPFTGSKNVQIRDHIVRYNWLNGANYTVVIGEYKDTVNGQPAPKPTADHLACLEMSIYDNVFYRDYNDEGGVFVQRSGTNDVPPGAVARGWWFDTLEQVPAGAI